AAAARFVPGPRPRTPEPIEALAAARCGFLEAPENRTRPGGRTIRPAAAQRGNLYDQPDPACPEPDRFNTTSVGLPSCAPRTQRLMLDAVKRCRDRLTADGTDLSAYNTTENAADFADLRTALGIGRWNVHGRSYGSNLAMTHLRLHPIAPSQSVSLPFARACAAGSVQVVGQTAHGLTNSVVCSERVPDQVLAQAPQPAFQDRVCCVSDVPDHTARTLPRSTTVQIAGIGHRAVPQSRCAQKVPASFPARPTAPDTTCVAGPGWEPFAITPM
ncbi:alpha/beta fold hydrolase, partial [Streptomyces nojiriensis]